jgi:hypothetical protein
MIERFEKLYWLINIILPVIGLYFLYIYENDESLYLFLIAILMWIIRWVVTGNHLTDNPYTGKSLISAINSLEKKYSSYSPDNDPWKKDSSYSPDNDPWKK